MWKTTGRMARVFLLLLVEAAIVVTVEAEVIERCNGAVLELVPCADSIRGKHPDPVSHGCCMALSELLLSPECLCYAATTAEAPFDMRQILGLPAACKYHVRPHQTCEGIPIPSYSNLLKILLPVIQPRTFLHLDSQTRYVKESGKSSEPMKSVWRV